MHDLRQRESQASSGHDLLLHSIRPTWYENFSKPYMAEGVATQTQEGRNLFENKSSWSSLPAGLSYPFGVSLAYGTGKTCQRGRCDVEKGYKTGTKWGRFP